MATSPEIERPSPPIEEIPVDSVVPPELEQGLKTIPSQPVNIPQVTDDITQQITPVPPPVDPTGPSITLPADPQTFAHQVKGSDEDTATWNAWFWLRLVKKALSKHITILVSPKGDQGENV